MGAAGAVGKQGVIHSGTKQRGMKRPPHSRGRLENDRVTQRLQTSDETTLDGEAVPLVEIVAAEVVVRLPVAQQVVDTDQDGVAHRHRGALGSAPGREATILCGQIGPMTTCSGM